MQLKELEEGRLLHFLRGCFPAILSAKVKRQFTSPKWLFTSPSGKFCAYFSESEGEWMLAIKSRLGYDPIAKLIWLNAEMMIPFEAKIQMENLSAEDKADLDTVITRLVMAHTPWRE
jgi:hypothetical protein